MPRNLTELHNFPVFKHQLEIATFAHRIIYRCVLGIFTLPDVTSTRLMPIPYANFHVLILGFYKNAYNKAKCQLTYFKYQKKKVFQNLQYSPRCMKCLNKVGLKDP